MKKILLLFIFLFVATMLVSAFNFRFIPNQNFNNNFNLIHPVPPLAIHQQWLVNLGDAQVPVDCMFKVNGMCSMQNTYSGVIHYEIQRLPVFISNKILLYVILTNSANGAEKQLLLGQINNLPARSHRMSRFSLSSGENAEWKYDTIKVKICNVGTNVCFLTPQTATIQTN